MGIDSILCSPGFRFNPTPVELVMYYLKRKILGRKNKFDVISELNLYQFPPWELPEKSCLKTGDLKWFFFCPRSRKFGNGSRIMRSTERGFWKATGRDRDVKYEERTVGFIKTLVFHEGCARKCERTNWVMHEYRLEDQKLVDCEIVQDAYVLCKIFKKSGIGPRNGSQYGATFDEYNWLLDDVDVQCVESAPSAVLEPVKDPASSSICTPTLESTVVPGPVWDTLCTPAQEPASVYISSNNCTRLAEPALLQNPESDLLNLSEDDILAMTLDCSEDVHLQSTENGRNEEFFNVHHLFDDLEDLVSLRGNISDVQEVPTGSATLNNTVNPFCMDDLDCSWLSSEEAGGSLLYSGSFHFPTLP